MPARFDDSLRTITLTPLPPRSPAPPPPAHHRARREGAASPPNLRATATEIVAPPPVIIVPPPPSVVVAPFAGLGAQNAAGAAPVVGPGTGSGGVGNGTGSGGEGDGDGGGGTSLEYRSGRLKDSDVPRWLPEGYDGTVGLRFTVGVKGRVTDCTVTRTSGYAALDALTCRLIVERLRYRPERDAAGRPIPQVVTGQHHWFVGRRPPEEDGDD